MGRNGKMSEHCDTRTGVRAAKTAGREPRRRAARSKKRLRSAASGRAVVSRLGPGANNARDEKAVPNTEVRYLAASSGPPLRHNPRSGPRNPPTPATKGPPSVSQRRHPAVAHRRLRQRQTPVRHDLMGWPKDPRGQRGTGAILGPGLNQLTTSGTARHGVPETASRLLGAITEYTAVENPGATYHPESASCACRFLELIEVHALGQQTTFTARKPS